MSREPARPENIFQAPDFTMFFGVLDGPPWFAGDRPVAEREGFFNSHMILIYKAKSILVEVSPTPNPTPFSDAGDRVVDRFRPEFD
jgi:hypothetical protein